MLLQFFILQQQFSEDHIKFNIQTHLYVLTHPCRMKYFDLLLFAGRVQYIFVMGQCFFRRAFQRPYPHTLAACSGLLGSRSWVPPTPSLPPQQVEVIAVLLGSLAITTR